MCQVFVYLNFQPCFPIIRCCRGGGGGGGGGGGEQARSSLLSQTINYYISPKSKVFGDFLTIFKVSNLGENNLI